MMFTIFIATVFFLVGFYIATVLWDSDFLPTGYKHDKEMDAMVQIEKNNDEIRKLGVQPAKAAPELFPIEPRPKAMTAKLPPRLPKGFKRHDGGKCPVRWNQRVSVVFMRGNDVASGIARDWFWDYGDVYAPELRIIGYKLSDKKSGK